MVEDSWFFRYNPSMTTINEQQEHKDSWNPQQYLKFQKERSLPFFDLMDLVQPENFRSAIDLGCGSGELTKIFQERFKIPMMKGIDNSGNMLLKAKTYEGNGLSFSLDDLAEFKFDKKFDVIISNAAIQWCDNHPAVFKRIVSALNPGGQIAIQMPANHDYPTHALGRTMEWESPYKDILKPTTHESSMLKLEDYASLLFKLGAKEQNVTTKVYGHVLESREGVVEWVKGTMLTYFQSNLPPEMYEKFLTEYRQRLFKILPDEKPFFYPFKRILMWARF